MRRKDSSFLLSIVLTVGLVRLDSFCQEKPTEKGRSVEVHIIWGGQTTLLLEQVEPAFDVDIIKKEKGRPVVIQANLAPSGKVFGAHAIEGDHQLGKEAATEVNRWVFSSPGKKKPEKDLTFKVIFLFTIPEYKIKYSEPESRSERKYSGEEFDFDFYNIELRYILMFFSKIASFNIIIDPDIEGKFTCDLMAMPYDQMLDLLLKLNNLEYKFDGSLMRIFRGGRPQGKKAEEK